MGRVVAISLVVVVLVVGLAGCGGSGQKASNSNAYDTCVARAQEAADAAVVERLYAAGKLGTASEVRRESSKKHSFLNKDGTMIPYARMTAWQRYELDEWRESGPALRVAYGEIVAAESHAASVAAGRCGHSG